MPDSIRVSVIIPAYNAAKTLAETLASVLAQTYADWEAVVVNDGSSDETARIAAHFAERDRRIRLTSQPQGGEGAARNAGIRLAHCDWLLFLDADDWLLPAHLELMTGALSSDPGLDAIHCGWELVTPDNTRIGEYRCAESPDLFPAFAQFCAFPVHACVVRRALVEAVGSFDTSLRTCADWDLWQRIARTGARFGALPNVLARYRMRPNSTWVDGDDFPTNGLRMVIQGHSPDPRVPHPAPAYINGLPVDQLPRAKLQFVCWPAGMVLGRGGDACPLLGALNSDHEPALDPQYVARSIFYAALLPNCQPPTVWEKLWPVLERRIEAFLRAIESQALATGLARRSRTILERMVLEHSTSVRPLTIGTTHEVWVEVTEPIGDILPPTPVERLRCAVAIEGAHLGMLELPVCDGRVPHQVLVDAIAAEFAWPIIGRFFTRTVYRQLDVQRKANSLSLWRGTVCLADGLSETQYPLGADRPWQGEDAVWQQVHERVGWTVFLQELWGRPYWPSAQFYDPQEREVATTRRRADCGWLVVEVTENLPDVEAGMQELTVVPTVSGVAVGTITIPTPGGFLYAHELRVEITKESGYELCRAAVREGLLGRPLAGPASLRVRLTATAAQHTQAGPQPAVPANPAFAPGMASALRRVLSTDERSIVIGRRAHGAIGTSVSRRAALPAAAAHELIAAAAVVGEPVLQTPTTHALTAPVIYAPDVIWRSVRPAPPVAVTRANNAVKRRGPLSSLLSPQITRTLQRTYKAALHVKDHIRSRMAVTERLPILMYHRVAPAGAPRLARYRVTPAAFEAQLQYLHDNGFYSVGLEDWRKAMVTQQPLPGRAVLLTFDDGTLDFFTYAWPLLQRYGFSAIVFLVAEEIGGSNRWDRAYGEAVPLLGWEHICQLQAVGIEFGSHSATHARLTALAPAGVVREGARSRMLLERELGVPVTAFSYPHGAEDQVVQHLIGACGYIFGLSCRAGLSGFQDPLLALPRIEVTDSDSLQSLVVL